MDTCSLVDGRRRLARYLREQLARYLKEQLSIVFYLLAVLRVLITVIYEMDVNFEFKKKET